MRRDDINENRYEIQQQRLGISAFGMAIRDLRCPDCEFATELGCKAFARGWHGNEDGKVAVCGGQVGL